MQMQKGSACVCVVCHNLIQSHSQIIVFIEGSVQSVQPYEKQPLAIAPKKMFWWLLAWPLKRLPV